MSEITLGSDPSEGAGSNEQGGAGVTGAVRELGPAVRELATSGVLTGAGGVVTLARGVQSIRRGDVGRGLLRLAVGGAFVAAAVAQRRDGGGLPWGRASDDVEPTDVVGRESDLGDVSSGLDAGNDTAAGTDPTEISETGPDIEDVDTGSSAGGDGGTDRGDVEETDVVTTGIDDGAPRAESGRKETDGDGTSEAEHGESGEGDRDDAGATVENEQG